MSDFAFRGLCCVGGCVAFVFVASMFASKRKMAMAWYSVLLAVAFAVGSATCLFSYDKEYNQKREDMFRYFASTPKNEWRSKDGEFKVLTVDGKTFVFFDDTEKLEVEKVSDGGVFVRDAKNGDLKVVVSKDLELVYF